MEGTVLRWRTFCDELESFLEYCSRQETYPNNICAQSILERMENVLVTLRIIHDNVLELRVEAEDDVDIQEFEGAVQDLIVSCQRVSSWWQDFVDSEHANAQAPSYLDTRYQTPQNSRVGAQGRPRFDISSDQLEYLSSLSFSWTQIASILGVSRMTIFRRRRDLNIPMRTSTLCDEELRRLIVNWKTEMPNIGVTIITGRLHAHGHHVPRERIRQAFRRVDPLSSALQAPRGLSSRRPYSVPGPNSLWHIDGHHKLVRWRLVTHAGIDGYSRMVVFMRCSNNNRAGTVYHAFLNAVQQYSLPSRVRCDQGRENTMVAAHMLDNRGVDRNSIIVGSSVHNQRIERLWRDMHRCVTQLFYRLFYYLEHNNYLNPINEVHIMVLHFVFLPRINQSLQNFKEAWNHHAIRTASSYTPTQLFVSRALQLRRSGLVALDFFDLVDNSYGLDEDGLLSTEDGVAVPTNMFTLREEHLLLLQQTVNPLSDSNNFGIDLFVNTLQFVTDIVQSHPQEYQN